MSLTAFQREGLQLLGYTKRESEFLFLVATHSGYFTIRQFKTFFQTESGSVSHAFIRKLLERHHASYHAYRSGGRVYHVFARNVYQAIERENLRTRKKHELDYVKTRLVALDFVLGNLGKSYLETGAEKVAFFENECGLKRELLPVKLYRARRSADVTPRYFVDRFPIFVDRSVNPPHITFTYVDAGAVTLEAFGTHLRGYQRLFRALPRVELVYVSPTPRHFAAAQTEFEHTVCRQASAPLAVSLADYFRIRKAWEAKERVASSEVILLKEAERHYAGRKFDQLYVEWLEGRIETKELARVASPNATPSSAQFRAQVYGSSLRIFTDPKAATAENCAETDARNTRSQSSCRRSMEISGA